MALLSLARLLLPATLLVAGAACCPIPIPRQVTVRPALDVEVVDGSGAPVAADVTVRRYVVGPPPPVETHRWTTTTDATGRASLPYEEARETSLPLMMHGVNWYAWEICAVAPVGGASSVVYASAPLEPRADVRLQLDPAASDCGWELMPTWEADAAP